MSLLLQVFSHESVNKLEFLVVRVTSYPKNTVVVEISH